MFVRSLFAVGLAAVLTGPATAQAQARRPAAQKAPAAAAPASTLAIAGWLGYEMGDLDGIQLRVDGVLPYQKLAPSVDLSFVGSVGLSRLTVSESAFGVDLDTTAWLLKVVPAARFTLPVNPELSLFGDAGLGLYYASVTAETSVLGTTAEASDSSVGLMLRLGAGGLYRLNPRTQLGASVMLDPMFGDYDDSTFAILVGLTYQL